MALDGTALASCSGSLNPDRVETPDDEHLGLVLYDCDQELQQENNATSNDGQQNSHRSPRRY